MRGSLSSAAASARRAISIFSSGERSAPPVLEVEVRHALDQRRWLRQPGVRILRCDPRQRRRLVDDPFEGLAREI